MSVEIDEEFIVRGPKFEYDSPTQPLGTILLQSMQEFSEDVAFVNGLDGSTETFGKFRSRSIHVAENMRLHGIGKGDNVCICALNQVNAFATVVGAVLIGAPVNGLDVGLSLGDFKHILNLLKPKAMFCEPAALPIVEQALIEIKLETLIVVYDEENTEHVSFSDFLVDRKTEESFKPVEIDNLKDATALIICSSGSSGLPKGVMISHYNVVGQITEAVLKSNAQTKPISVVFTTIYWMTGLLILFNCLKYGFKRVFVPKPFSEKLAAETIQNYKPTSALFSPSMCNRLVKYPEIHKYNLQSLGMVFIVGGVTPPSQVAMLSKLIPNSVVTMGYGMTEFAGGIAGNLANCSNFRSTGKLFKGMSAKVIDIETGKPLSRNKTGEIYLKSDYVMRGYFNNPEETAATLGKDGWLKTGDMGYFDEEGFLYLTDRIKEVLKFQNWPICPTEIEVELMSHPDVVECGVVGLPHEVYGDLLVAFVLLVKDAKVKEQELKDYVAERVSDAKKLRGGIIFIQNIPMLPSGKVNRKFFKTKALEMKEQLIANAD